MGIKIKKRNLVVFGIIGLVGIFIAIGSLYKNDDKKAIAGEISNDLVETKEDIKKKNEIRYLPLEEDSFADDAKVVEKNIRDLLTGKKTFPIRDDGKKVAYLTFDDGPSTTITPDILKVLKEENIKSTFFVLGSSLDKNDKSKEILKDIVKDGHPIPNHTYTHDYKKLYPNGKVDVDYFLKEIEKTNKSIKNVIGDSFNNRVIRFPGGYWSWDGREVVKRKLEEKKYFNIDWNTLNGDAEGAKISEQNLLKKLKASVNELGDNADNIIVLMHDTYNKETTLKSLKESIRFLKEKGFEFRTIK